MKKFSRKRQAILDVLMHTDSHPTAAWIYEQLKPTYPDLSLATVYRNLSEFLRDSTIISVGTVNGQERYDGNILPHTHFVCRGCNSVYDLPDYDDSVIDYKIASSGGYLIERHELVFHGLCNNCTHLSGQAPVTNKIL